MSAQKGLRVCMHKQLRVCAWREREVELFELGVRTAKSRAGPIESSPASSSLLCFLIAFFRIKRKTCEYERASGRPLQSLLQAVFLYVHSSSSIAHHAVLLFAGRGWTSQGARRDTRSGEVAQRCERGQAAVQMTRLH